MKKIFNSGLTFVRKLSERFCRKINKHLFSDEKLIALIAETFDAHLCWEKELDLNTTVEYDIITDFSPEDVAFVESQEKGSTNDRLLATTSIYDAGAYLVVFALEAMKDSAFKLWPWQVKKEIQGTAKHEAFHVRQYNYICQHGGLEALDRLTEYLATTPYEDNILELGAYLYQWFDEVQDFQEDFEYFITPPAGQEADQTAA